MTRCFLAAVVYAVMNISVADDYPLPQLSAGEPRLLTQPYRQSPTQRGVTVALSAGTPLEILLMSDQQER